MADPYLGEIRWFPYVRGAPTGWLLCDGTLQPIANYDTLFTLLGTTYGGDGQSTFGVPDLRGSVPIHQGAGPGLAPYALGAHGGSETIGLTAAQMGPHAHMLVALEKPSTSTTPTGNLLAQPPDGDGVYTPTIEGATAGAMGAAAVGPIGGGMPHENCMPTLVIRPCIAYAGIFPPQP